jgi:hypothetical protein
VWLAGDRGQVEGWTDEDLWLQDIAGPRPDQAAASICWTAETICLGALYNDAPSPP